MKDNVRTSDLLIAWLSASLVGVLANAVAAAALVLLFCTGMVGSDLLASLNKPTPRLGTALITLLTNQFYLIPMMSTVVLSSAGWVLLRRMLGASGSRIALVAVAIIAAAASAVLAETATSALVEEGTNWHFLLYPTWPVFAVPTALGLVICSFATVHTQRDSHARSRS